MRCPVEFAPAAGSGSDSDEEFSADEEDDEEDAEEEEEAEDDGGAVGAKRKRPAAKVGYRHAPGCVGLLHAVLLAAVLQSPHWRGQHLTATPAPCPRAGPRLYPRRQAHPRPLRPRPQDPARRRRRHPGLCRTHPRARQRRRRPAPRHAPGSLGVPRRRRHHPHHRRPQRWRRRRRHAVLGSVGTEQPGGYAGRKE